MVCDEEINTLVQGRTQRRIQELIQKGRVGVGVREYEFNYEVEVGAQEYNYKR